MQNIVQRLKRERDKYRPIPFWSWNDALETNRLKDQIHWMHENGIGGFFMHARCGLKTDYLSDEWMQCIRFCCEEAQKLGMQAWAYDENGWPSGFAGGRLLEKMENRDRYILHTIGPFDKCADIHYKINEEQLIRVHQKTDNVQYLNLYIKYSASSVDILNPDVVDQFLQVTHEQYKSNMGEQFSQLLHGFFTDEPQYYRWATPFTPMLQRYFQEHYGEDILDKLGLLFVEKEGYRAFRYRYWKAMQTLLLENYAKKIYEWCDANYLQFTGHYIEESTLGYQMMCCGGVMPFYAYQHIPGIDCLAKDAGNPLPSRQVSSVARQLGKKQILTESFAACGWDVTPGELRKIAGYQFVNGVNTLCHHLLPYSEKGARKRDYPVHFTKGNPWVKDSYKTFNDYFTNLGCLLAESEEPVNVAVLHPIRSAYFDYKREKESQQHCIGELETSLREVCSILSSRGINFHFLDETLMEKYGFVRDGKIGCGQCQYTHLVLPSLLTMGRETEIYIRNFVEQNGKILILGQKPTYLEGEAYDYSYLQSNCTIEQLEKEQPFQVYDYNENICSTYRVLDGQPVMYVQNISDNQCYTQTYYFREGYKSLLVTDPVTGVSKRAGTTITLEPNEGMLLLPDLKPAEEPVIKSRHTIQFQNAQVQFEKNYLPVDLVRYSYDGVTYSEPLHCAQLFENLLQQRYDGGLYLKYEFEIETLPEYIEIIVEHNDDAEHTVNGIPLADRICFIEDEKFLKADITDFVKQGNNDYVLKMHWSQKEETYYALFGENVTESLKNCVAYDGEIEAIYLAGKFGVYSHDTWECTDPLTVTGGRFYIGQVPQNVSEPTTDGFPFFSGNLTLKQIMIIPDKNTILDIAGRYGKASVRVNGIDAGSVLFERILDISELACEGTNEIEVAFTIGNRNLLGPFFLSGPDGFVGPAAFGAGKEDYRYRLYLFYRK